MSAKKIGIVFNTGLGDGLMLLPLIQALKVEGYKVSIIISSKYMSSDVLSSFDSYGEIMEIGTRLIDIVRFSIARFRKFDYFLVSFTSSSLTWIAAASWMSKFVITNRKKWYLRLFPTLLFQDFSSIEHVTVQNIRLAKRFLSEDNVFLKKDINVLTYIGYRQDDVTISPIDGVDLYQNPCFVVQVSAANNQVKYKNWKIENWIIFFRLVNELLPKASIILLGDANETCYADTIMDANLKNISSRVGQTTLSDVSATLAKSTLYIGLDSGLMQLAAFLGKPTFTIWGPTEPAECGYQIIDASRHRDICLRLPCHPCKSNISPNKTRYNHPSKCPDLACINNIEPLYVFEEFMLFYNQLFPKK